MREGLRSPRLFRHLQSIHLSPTKDITPILESIGLLDSESSTYLVALENGPSTVIDLSRASKLSRQATYTAIDLLTERGKKYFADSVTTVRQKEVWWG